MKNTIFETLTTLGLTSLETREIFNDRTRDIEGLVVYRDSDSGVIYIEDFSTSDEIYEDGLYRDDIRVVHNLSEPNYEREKDLERRFNAFLPYVEGKNVLDFGCGHGDFLRKINADARSVCGVELQHDFISYLNSVDIKCVNDLTMINDQSIDTCVSFHAIEHLDAPLETLSVLKQKIVPGGQIIIEVPHANDYLLTTLKNEAFKNFTLWSQHLILHTRESLTLMLDKVGFDDVHIMGMQRYPLSNHLFWLINNKPGGHKSDLSVIDTDSLHSAYTESLADIDATDTLVAIARN